MLEKLKEQKERILSENNFCKNPDFEKGKYLYMFMMDINNKTRCFGIGYTISYAIKKGIENSEGILKENISIARPRINKILTGDTEKMDTFELDALLSFSDQGSSWTHKIEEIFN